MKRNKTIYIALLMMMFSFTTIYANGITELKIEDAIIKAQNRSNKLRAQRTNIEAAQVDQQAARESFENVSEFQIDNVISMYSKATTNVEYERKNEKVIREQVAFEIETQFDDILELEERYELASRTLKIQREKVNQAIIKEQMGLGSKIVTQGESAKLEAQDKEIEGLIQAIETGYRKLNDAIGGKEERYRLIKENIYKPLNMKSSLGGQVSYALNGDIGLWRQEELAKSETEAFAAPGPDGYAPTYTLYQQRKLNYAQAMNNVSLTKEAKEEQVKRIHENIQVLQIQHDQIVLELEEAQRQYEVMEKRYELGMITAMSLQEAELELLQKQGQLSSTIRQHNQMKMLFENSHLSK